VRSASQMVGPPLATLPNGACSSELGTLLCSQRGVLMHSNAAIGASGGQNVQRIAKIASQGVWHSWVPLATLPNTARASRSSLPTRFFDIAKRGFCPYPTKDCQQIALAILASLKEKWLR